ncbi:MAG: hypothetical protein IIU77_07165 [Clostridia bacterium]|nr:hypothetical protein [Clostridia bacterium]
MKVSLIISGSLYNCEVIVKDLSESKKYVVNLEDKQSSLLEIDVESNSFELTLVPEMPDYKSAFSDMETQNWKDKLAKKVGNSLCSIIDKMLLRVGCTYNISGIQENDVICVADQEYVLGTFDKFNLFEFVPMAYMFFEAFHGGTPCECSNAFAINRKEVISSAKKLVLLNFGLHLFFTYPIQIGRIKKLTSDRKINKTLMKFNKLSEKERQKVLDKQEKFISH